MNDFLEKLFHAADVKEFAALAKEVPATFENPAAFLAGVADYLPLRLYEHYYGETPPHSLFGLVSAHQAQSLLPEDQCWKPFTHQAWLVTRERKRTPWDLDTMDPQSDGSLDDRWHRFEMRADAGDFREAFCWAKGFFKADQERDFFRERSLSYSMDDTAYGGYKFLYLKQAWRLAELLNWNHLEKILFPALHFTLTATKEKALSTLVRDRWRTNPLPALLQNEAPLSEPSYRVLEQSLLFGHSATEALDVLQDLSQKGVALEAIRDALLIASARALSNAKLGHWIWPMRAFHFGYLSRQWMDWVEPHRKTYALLMTAALLHQASARSRELEHNRPLDELATRLCPTDTFTVLKSVVSHSDPYASATAVYAILGMSNEKKAELFQTLMQLAIKNDGQICYGNDLLFVQEAVECYQRSLLGEKDNYLVAAGFFLGRVPKKYDLTTAYGKS